MFLTGRQRHEAEEHHHGQREHNDIAIMSGMVMTMHSWYLLDTFLFCIFFVSHLSLPSRNSRTDSVTCFTLLNHAHSLTHSPARRLDNTPNCVSIHDHAASADKLLQL